MPRKMRIQYPGALYHVTSRGNARRVIFHTDVDRARFLDQLRDRVESYGVIVYAFVLMGNHYHLLIRSPRANLSRFMQRLNTSYALYYRYKHSRPGHVFQGRYKALLVTDDSYVLTLSRYIHLNPVKTTNWKDADRKETLSFLNGYRWSSYPAYASGTSTLSWLNLDVLSHYGQSRRQASARYRAYTEAMITKNDDELLASLKAAAQQLGPEDSDFKQYSAKEAKDISPSALDKIVADHFRVDAQELAKHGHAAGAAKRVAIELATRVTGQSLKKVGQHYGGISASAVTMNRSRLRNDDLKHIEKILKCIDSV
jgi:putative transposase